MACPKCGSHDYGDCPNGATNMEKVGLKWAQMHPPTAVAAIGFTLAKTVAKMAFSTAYQCNNCRHQWRVWGN